MRRTERQIFSYDLVVGARAQHAVAPSLLEIAQAWQDMHTAGTCSHERERGTVIYRLGDIEIDPGNQIVRLLIRRCDTNAANAVYSHKLTGAQRVAMKEDDEGGDRAAHLVISLQQQTNQPDHYLCHLEGVSGLSHRLVQATLNAVLKRARDADPARFHYPDPGGARVRGGGLKLTPFLPNVELQGHPSPNLTSDIENGRIRDIRLVASTPHNVLGGNQFLTEREYQMTVSVDQNLPRQNRVQTLIAAFRSKGTQFQTAKIVFDDPSGINRRIDYDIATGTPEQQTYVRSYLVSNIDPPLDESSLELVPFLTNAMQNRILAERS